MQIEISIKGRECLKMEWSEGDVKPSFEAIGGLQFLRSLQAWAATASGSPSGWPLPQGTSTADLVLREAVLRFRGQWSLPYDEIELCHCRAVSREGVENAIRCGAHTTEMVSRWTAASTACGTCRPDSQSLIDYYLSKRPGN